MTPWIQLARPWQWSKNGILFAGLIFSRHLQDGEYVVRSVVAAAVFCLASSAVYAINDVADAARDRLHPEKRERPVASGRIRRTGAMAFGAILLAAAAMGAFWLGGLFPAVLLAFLTLNTSYSVLLKNFVILDVLLIALSFVVRAVAGVAALWPLSPNLEISPWLLICTLFLALFLGFGKRRHELVLLEDGATGHRASLEGYSAGFLDQLIAIVAASTLIGYAIYTVAPETVSKFGTRNLVVTIPFVVYGVFRYLYLVRRRGEGGNPSRILYRDTPILAAVVGWLAAAVVILYVRP